MTVVSSKEFATNQRKYYNLAENEQVVIKRGNKMFYLICNPVEKIAENEPDMIFEPDEDFYDSISMDELRQRTYDIIDNFFSNNESCSITEGT